MPQATASEELPQGPYMAARVGFEPATFQKQGIEPTTEPPCQHKDNTKVNGIRTHDHSDQGDECIHEPSRPTWFQSMVSVINRHGCCCVKSIPLKLFYLKI